jgi:phytanoyl-CoA dioxygenase PhyH
MTDELGYSLHDHVFHCSEMTAALDELSASKLSRTKAGARHILMVPPVQTIAHDPRLFRIASEFVGAAPVPFRATLFDKSPSSNWLVAWHQDTALPLRRRIESPEWGSWSEKAGILYAHAPAWALERVIALRVHLDDSTQANGPLRVLPATHRLGVLDDERIDHLVQCAAALNCVALSGGVVAMRPLAIHASSKSTDPTPRRVLHIEYARTLELGCGAELAVT